MFDPSAQFELQVCPNGRQSADEYFHQGSIWIEGRENSKYTLIFTNRSSNRVMVVFSVDGLDTIKGQPAGLNSDGYIVNARSNIEVPGWTLDNTSAAEFFFSKAGRSYVTSSGNNTNNTGVIGAMVFKEQITWPTLHRQAMVRSKSIDMGNNAWYSSSASLVPQDIGTGFGNATQFNTVSATFNKANPTAPDAILAIYYNTAKNLEKLGINVRTIHTRYNNSSAEPFPAYTSGCKPPLGWTK